MSWKMVGRPIAPRPIISPAAPVASKHAEAVAASTTSPFAMTGMSTASTMSRICSQSAVPEYLCLSVRPWTQIRSMPSASSLSATSSAVFGPPPVPSLTLTVIGTLATSRQARTISTTRSGSLRSAAPASLRHTLGAGQPKLMSMTSALSCKSSTVCTISSVMPPKICGMKGCSRGSLSTFSHECVSRRVRPDAAVNSVTVTSAPHSRASNL